MIKKILLILALFSPLVLAQLPTRPVFSAGNGTNERFFRVGKTAPYYSWHTIKGRYFYIDSTVIPHDTLWWEGVSLTKNYTWLGKHIFKNVVTFDSTMYLDSAQFFGSKNYISGWAGSGWKLDYGLTDTTGRANLELDNLTIRGQLSVYELLIRQIRATNGAIFVSASAKVKSVVGTTIIFEDPSYTGGTYLCPFAAGDLLIVQRFRPDGTTVIKLVQATVSSVSGASAVVTYQSGTFSKGDEVVRIGNTTNTARQNSIYLTSDDNNSPFMDMITGVNSWTTWGSAAKTKLRIGNLAGITDTDFGGALTGYGLYAQNVFLKGKLQIVSNADIIGLTFPTATYTSGISFPVSPVTADWHFYTKNPPDSPYKTNTWYRYSGSTWVEYGLTGTYIDGTGIYTGTIVANQVIAGTLTGFTIQTKADPGIGDRSRVVIGANSNNITFYDEANRAFTLSAYGNIMQFSGGVSALAFQAANVYGTNLTTNYGITFDEFPNPATIAKDVNKNIILSGGALNAGIIASQTWVSSRGYLTSYTETDPTIYAWAKAAAKPSYAFSEIGSKPTTLSGYGITDGLTSASSLNPANVAQTASYRFVTDTEKGTWNGKENVLSFSAPLSRSVNVISIPAASSSQAGYLTSADWNSFNSRSIVSMDSNVPYAYVASYSGGPTNLPISIRVITINGSSYSILAP